MTEPEFRLFSLTCGATLDEMKEACRERCERLGIEGYCRPKEQVEEVA